MTQPAEKKSSVLSLDLSTLMKLRSAYMPFIKNGGLFIQSSKPYQLGDEIFVLLKLMELEDKFTIPGKVVWVSPAGSYDGSAMGVGIQFKDPDNPVRGKIETLLAGHLDTDRRTDTM